MRKPFILLLVVTLLILCGVPAVQSFRLARQKEKLEQLRAEQDQTSRQLADLQADNERLQSQRRELRQQMLDMQLASSPAGLPPATADSTVTPPSSSGSESQTSEKQGPALGSFLGKMMKDPEMRKFVSDQQRQMLDPLYQPLIKRLGLTAEQAGAFKDLLASSQMKGTEHAAALFGGSATNRADAMAALAAEQKQSDEQIRALLGEEGYAQYKDYQQTLSERVQLNQFSAQAAGAGHPLTDEQTEWLLTLMNQEKQAVAAATGRTLPGDSQNPANLQAMFSSEQAEQFLQMQETVNQRVYQQAAAGLSPEQMEAFGQFQTNQLAIMRMGMSMARKLFAPESATSEPDSSAR